MRCTARYPCSQSAAWARERNFRLLGCCACLGLIALCSAAVPLAAQNQRLVYASVAENQTISGFTVNPANGTLYPIPGSPLSVGFAPHAIAVHPSGKFLYVLNVESNDVSVFQINPTTGALTELPTSPFAAGMGTTPLGIVIDVSGKFLFELETTSSPASNYLNSYAIDQDSGALTPTTMPSNDVTQDVPNPVDLLADPVSEELYLIGNTEQFSALVTPFPIDSTSGDISPPGNAFGQAGQQAISAAISPNGRFWYVGLRQNEGEIEGSGTLLLTMSAQDFPDAMAVDSTSSYLYVWFAKDGLRGFAIDPGSGELTELSGSPFVPAGVTTSLVADPTGPFLYSSNYGAFQISTNGSLTSMPGFSVSGITGIGTFGPSAPVQPVSGPAVTFVPPSLSFQSQAVGSVSAPQQISVTNSGNQDLIVNSVSIAGTNSADFTIQSNNCLAVLAPSASCMVTITYQTSTVGPSQALLTINDNVADGISTAAILGSSFVPSPAVTLVPGSLSFPDTDEGVFSVSKSVVVINSGTAALHVPVNGVTLTGANPGDFSQTNTCNNGTIAVESSCTITVTFQPTAAGTRTAQVQISDDGQNAPQSVSLSGSSLTPFVLESSGNAAQAVPAGMTAQYDLQLVPAGGFTGTVLLSCAGAPQGSVCTVPATVQVSSANGVGFVVTVSTTARSIVPISQEPRAKPVSGEGISWSECFGFLAWLLLLLVRLQSAMLPLLRRYARRGAATAFLLIVSLALVSCGGGSTASGPASTPAGTPAGPSTLTVTASADGVAQTFNLLLTVE